MYRQWRRRRWSVGGATEWEGRQAAVFRAREEMMEDLERELEERKKMGWFERFERLEGVWGDEGESESDEDKDGHNEVYGDDEVDLDETWDVQGESRGELGGIYTHNYYTPLEPPGRMTSLEDELDALDVEEEDRELFRSWM